MRRLTVSLVAVLAALLMFSSVVMAEAEHCPGEPGGNGDNKVQSTVDGDLNGIVLEAGTIFCVKAGSEGSGGATGFLTADGETTLQEYLFAEGIVDGSEEEGRDVSYYVTYESTETESPSTSASPSVPESPSTPASPSEPESPSTPATASTSASPSAPELGGGTPPDTAMGGANTGITAVLALIALASLGALALLRVRRME